MAGTSQRRHGCVVIYGAGARAQQVTSCCRGGKHAEVCVQVIASMNHALYQDDIHDAH
jgi:hypothetical protein